MAGVKVELDLDGKNALRTINNLTKALDTFANNSEKTSKKLDSSFSVFKGALGAVGVVSALNVLKRSFSGAVDDALAFSKSLAEINSIAPRTAVETQALGQQLILFSNQFSGNPQKQARAFYNIVSAGIQGTAQQLAVLQVSNKAAVAGLVDINDAARVIVSSMNSYTQAGLTAAQASDALFVAVREGQTTFTELANTIGPVAPIAAQAGVTFSELTGTIAAITKTGTPTVEAVTGIKAILTSVIKPTEQASKRAAELGLDFTTAAIRSKGFAQFLKDVQVATKGADSELATLFPNVRALGPVLALVSGNFNEFKRILNETGNAAGASDKAFQIISKSAAFQFERLTQELKNLPQAFLINFEEPIADIIKEIRKFVGGDGMLLIVDAVDITLDAFRDFSDGMFKVREAIRTTSDLIDKTLQIFGRKSAQEGLEETKNLLKEYEEQARALGKTADTEFLSKSIQREEEAINSVNVERERDLKAREERNAKIQALQDKISAAREKQVEQAKKVNEALISSDKKVVDKEIENAQASVTNAQNLNNTLAAIAQSRNQDALEALQREREIRQNFKQEDQDLAIEEEELRKEQVQLNEEEQFSRLEAALGRERALREIHNIQLIKDEAKKAEAIKKLNDQVRKEEKAGILSRQKFENLTNRERIANQLSTLNKIATLTESNNSTLFAIGKAAALGVAIVEGLKAHQIALASAPPPFNFILAALVDTASALTIAKIASAKKPSAGSFQDGGIIEGSSQFGDRLTANVNAGEAIFNRRQQENLFRAVDSGNLGGGSVTVNLNKTIGSITDEEIDAVIDAINDRTEFGNKALGVA